jgi:hypothetical protein
MNKHSSKCGINWPKIKKPHSSIVSPLQEDTTNKEREKRKKKIQMNKEKIIHAKS